MFYNGQKVEKKLTLLKPVKSQPRLDQLKILSEPTVRDILDITDRPASLNNDPMALDFETKGFPLEDGTRVVGVGLSDSRGSWYLNLQTDNWIEIYNRLIQELDAKRIPLLAHNLNFDAMWIARDHRTWLNWRACTYAAYRLTATEGWPGQKWGLKDAQVELLGWAEKGDVELDQWLVEAGYGDRITVKETGEWRLRPAKNEMWRAPVEILGKYCALDADSTYQLWMQVLEPCVKKFKALNIYLTNWYPKYERILIEQSLTGIKVDLDRLAAHEQATALELQLAKDAIYSNDLIAPFNDLIKTEALNELRASEPAQFKKAKPIPTEPPQFTKANKVSANWLKWKENIALGKYEPQPSLNWPKWNEKYEAALEQVEWFNLNSYEQKKRLFYEVLYPQSHKDVIKRRQGNQDVNEEYFRLITPQRSAGVLLPLTKSGGVPVNRVALKQIGDVGKVFLNYQELIKEYQFIEGLQANHKAGILHPQFRVPGTLTGRLSGGGGRSKGPPGVRLKGFNFQQVPKSPGFLRCFVPREGKTFVDVDHTALEQVVLAELSKDEALWKLFGPEAKPNDVYLFVGAGLPGEIGAAIRKYGYDPLNPVPSIIALTKEKCKRERGIAKIVQLGGSYKMGAAKLQRTLSLEGTEITFEQAREIHRAFWELYKGVKRYENEHLLPQYDDNDGWVLNGIGRPIGIFEKYRNDIVNRVVQSTGHDLHVLFVTIVEEVLKAAGVKFNWIIADFHDQSIVEVDVKDAERVRDLLNVDCYTKLNNRLKGQIPLKGDAQIVEDLAYAKVAKEDIKQYLKDIGIIEEDESEEG